MCKKNSWCEKFLKFIHSRHIGTKINIFVNTVLYLHKPMKQRLKPFSAFFDYLILNKLEKYWMAYNQSLIEKFYADQRCIECMKCVKGCPRDNIVLKDKIEFGKNCDTCFFCIHNCPVEMMGKQYKSLNDKDIEFIKKQKLFYIASCSGQEVNLSPKEHKEKKFNPPNLSTI